MIRFPPRFGHLREEPPTGPGPERKKGRTPDPGHGVGFGQFRGRSDIERCAQGRTHSGDPRRLQLLEVTAAVTTAGEGLLPHGPRDLARTPGGRIRDVRRDGLREEGVGARDGGHSGSRGCVPAFGCGCGRQLPPGQATGPRGEGGSGLGGARQTPGPVPLTPAESSRNSTCGSGGMRSPYVPTAAMGSAPVAAPVL